MKEAMEILKCSDKTIRTYYGDGRLEHKKIGQRKVLILKSSVDALLEGRG
nr:helix-turn-helix domain-containing protein [Pontiella sulfatireligans]